MGIVHFEFNPQGQRVNQVYYVEILKQLHKAAYRKRPEFWPSDWNLHNDAPMHKALPVKQAISGPEIDY
jgi:hypothetical protein